MIVTSAVFPGSEIELSESSEHFLVIATEVAKALNWEVAEVHSNGFLAYTSGTSQLPGEQVRLQINGNIAEISTEYSHNYIADEQTSAINIHNFLQGIQAVKYYFTTEELELKYFQLQSVPGFDPSAPAKPQVAESKIPASLGSVKDYPVTAVVVASNVILFAIMLAKGADVLQPATGMMIEWGANFGLKTLDGEWWRLLTSCFLHFGVVHLLMNMYALIYVGLILEPQLGSTRVAVAYLLTGIVASLTSVWWHSWVVAAGASGAVFGMYGVLLALLTTNYMEQKLRKPMLMSIGFFVVYNLAYGLNDGIDNAAHIGGLLSGMIIGYVYVYTSRYETSRRFSYAMLIGLTVVILGLSGTIYKRIPNSLAIYNQQISTFAQNEISAENALKYSADKTIPQKLRTIEDTALKLWKKNAVLIGEVNKIDLPEEIEKRNQLLKMYTDLRIQGLGLEYKALKENTVQYQEPLASIDRQLQMIRTSLQPQ
jgi:rhomboid protease GluP